MKTAIVTAVLILVCIFSVTAWFITGLDLRMVQANADYYYTELAAASYQIGLANAKIAELECEAEELKNRLEIANDIVAELRDRNHELRGINCTLQQKAELRYFESTEALGEFLFESDVDHHIYITPGSDFRTYDCEDYAIALRDDAHAKGFYMSIQVVWQYRRPDTGEFITRYGEGYALNSTIIGNEIYFIEPSTDDYWLAAYLD